MPLDCTSQESALATAAALLGVTERRFAAACRAVDPENRRTGDVLSELGNPSIPRTFDAMYFHATRVVDPTSFRHAGILPRVAALDGVWTMLEPIAVDICGPDGWT